MIALALTAWASLASGPASESVLPLQAEAEQIMPKQTAGALMSIRTGQLLALVGADRLVETSFPPGSIMKVVSAYAAIRNEQAERVFPCEGMDIHRGVTRTCWLRAGHGRLGLRQAVAASCDIYFYKLARLLGPDRLMTAARSLGLGTTTGSDVPRESAGQLPDPLSEQDVASFAVGRMPGLSVTGMQLLSLTAAIANGGQLVTPHLRGNFAPRAKVADLNALDLLGRSMRDAVQSGTGAAASDLPIAGKTGTAPMGEGDNTVAWFMGYAPDDAPEVAVVVFISEGLGARDAAAISADLVRAYFRGRSVR